MIIYIYVRARVCVCPVIPYPGKRWDAGQKPGLWPNPKEEIEYGQLWVFRQKLPSPNLSKPGIALSNSKHRARNISNKSTRKKHHHCQRVFLNESKPRFDASLCWASRHELFREGLGTEAFASPLRDTVGNSLSWWWKKASGWCLDPKIVGGLFGDPDFLGCPAGYKR